MQIIPIEKELIPYAIEIELGGEVYRVEINYNLDFDFFTVNLLKGNEALAYGEKIVYGNKLFDAYKDSRFPDVDIIVKDIANEETRVTWDNFQETIFLFVEEA